MRLAARLSVLAGWAASNAHAQQDAGCPPEAEEALRHVNGPAALKGQAISRHCKPWPPSGGKTLAAVMAFEQGSDPNRRWTGVLALIDARSARLLHSYSFKLAQDGPGTDLSIDRKPRRKLQVYRYNGRHYEVLSSQWDWDDYCCSVGWPAAR